jgi:hypothetical protein
LYVFDNQQLNRRECKTFQEFPNILPYPFVYLIEAGVFIESVSLLPFRLTSPKERRQLEEKFAESNEGKMEEKTKV